ncbi:MAG: short chain dehydrogenase [Candidatus Thermoplasmatota archaeon]|nr:short chain dehydrogenase [Candidatus Thermoplasmatota archaeon]MCL5668191.1 short chain dehydrogenase [Candidatus Thermoplasmatota archaeon]
MNKKAAFSVTLIFIIVFLYEVIQITGSEYVFTPQSQVISQISTGLFNSYLLPFELISMILVGSIIGVLYIAGRSD